VVVGAPLPMWATDAGELPPPHAASKKAIRMVPTMPARRGRARAPPAPTSVVPVRMTISLDSPGRGGRRSRTMSTWYTQRGTRDIKGNLSCSVTVMTLAPSAYRTRRAPALRPCGDGIMPTGRPSTDKCSDDNLAKVGDEHPQ